MKMKMWIIPHESDYPTIQNDIKECIEDCLVNINYESNIPYSIACTEKDARKMVENILLTPPYDAGDSQFLIELDIKARCIVSEITQVVAYQGLQLPTDTI